jgi:hypothetical protein
LIENLACKLLIGNEWLEILDILPENPCVGGSIPSLAINDFNHLQQVARPAVLLLGQSWDNSFSSSPPVSQPPDELPYDPHSPPTFSALRNKCRILQPVIFCNTTFYSAKEYEGRQMWVVSPLRAPWCDFVDDEILFLKLYSSPCVRLMLAARLAMVGDSKSVRNGNSICKASYTRDMTWAAMREFPPISKKLSSTPI